MIIIVNNKICYLLKFQHLKSDVVMTERRLNLVLDTKNNTILVIGHEDEVCIPGNLVILGEDHEDDCGCDAEVYPLDGVLAVGTGR